MSTPIPERGISMSAPMIRSYMAGLKGCTRRLMKVQPPEGADILLREREKGVADFFNDHTQCLGTCKCPYGAPGDELYFKETFCHLEREGYKPIISYKADDPQPLPAEGWSLPPGVKWKSGRFMPRVDSRFRHIPITGIRVERLGDISEHDAQEEGARLLNMPDTGFGWTHDALSADRFETARHSFEWLWTQIHGPDSWDLDKMKFVWVISFPKHKN